ncbi:MAG: SdrD B-like domain-containing protein, partial [Paraperlucidibaca sp.]
MNHQNNGTVNTAEKKENRSFPAFALVVGMVMAFAGAAAWAGSEIPGVDVKLGKNPGGIVASTTTGKGGAYQFTELAPGKYELFVADQPEPVFYGDAAFFGSTGARGSITGILSRNDDGTVTITVNGQSVLLPNATISQSGGTLAMETLRGASPSAGPGDERDAELGTTPVNGIGGQGGGRFTFKPSAGKRAETGTVAGGGAVKPGGTQSGIADQGAAGNLTSYSTAPPPKEDGGQTRSAVKPSAEPSGYWLVATDGGIVDSAPADADGAFLFNNLP